MWGELSAREKAKVVIGMAWVGIVLVLFAMVLFGIRTSYVLIPLGVLAVCPVVGRLRRPLSANAKSQPQRRGR
jgi:hypothetical protein